MALGNSREEADLVRHLADTLVEKEVMEPMNKIGWGHGTPPAPDRGTTPPAEGAPAADPSKPSPAQGGQPAPEAPAKPGVVPPAKADAPASSEPGFNIEDFKDPETGKYFGKYDSATEALKGLGHLAQMAKTSFSQRDTALAEAARLRDENEKLRTQPAASPAASPNTVTISPAARAEADRARATYDQVLAKVVEEGGVLDEDSAKRLSEAQRDLSRTEARLAAEETLASRENAKREDQEKWEKVDVYMKEHHPDSLTFADEIGLFIQSNPLLQEAVSALVAQGKEIKASELAWTSYSQDRGMTNAAEIRAKAAEKEAELAAKGQVRSELVEAARADAGVVTGSAGGQGIHQKTGTSGPSREEIAQAAAEMSRTGEAPGTPAAARFRDLIIGRFLDPAVFGPSG